MSTGYVKRKITGQVDHDRQGEPGMDRRIARQRANADYDPSEHWGSYNPTAVERIIEDPEWTRARLPSTYEKYVLGKINYYWAYVVYPVRQVARAILWITVTPYRFAAVIITALMFWAMIHSG